jgi:hypothetical protein
VQQASNHQPLDDDGSAVCRVEFGEPEIVASERRVDDVTWPCERTERSDTVARTDQSDPDSQFGGIDVVDYVQ